MKGLGNVAFEDRVNAAIKQLEEGLERITTDEDFIRWLDVQARFHKYSPNNTILIVMQRPDATRVAGYRAWQKMGRQVRRGEQAIKILAPLTRRVTLEDDDGNEEQVQRIIGFKLVNVFDVSQTDGEPLPELDVRIDGDSPEAQAITESLAAFAEESGIPIIYEELNENIGGYFNVMTNSIAINTKSSANQQAKTLAHELGHALLHADLDEETTESQRETEAEAVAYIVARHFGMDPGDTSFQYIAAFSRGDMSIMKASMSRIAKGANTIIEHVVKNSEYSTEAVSA